MKAITFCVCGETHAPVDNAKRKKPVARRLTPLRADPSRTTLLQRKYLAELARRFRALRKEIYQLIVEEDAFGLKDPEPFDSSRVLGNAARRRWAFLTIDKKLEQFTQWLTEMIDVHILGIERGETPITAKYVESAYKKGIVRAWTDTNRRRLGLGRPGPLQGTQEQFLRQSFGAPERASKLKLLQTRAFENLKGVTQQMATQMNRTLADGLAAGDSPLKVAKALEERANLPEARARTVARTEVMHAHSEGQLDGMQELGVEEVGVMVEWSTAGDDRVCPICKPLEGVVLTIDEARGLIPRHPNCRCTWIPANVGEDESEQKRNKARLKAAIDASVKAETKKKTAADAREQSRWSGADKKIAGKKPQPELKE